VSADPDRLRQVVTNLIENALRHASSSAPVRVHAERSAGGVRIAVRDSGPGIAAANVERIFRPGVRLSSAPGSGLGLAIARELTEAMGGTISVSSKPGRGSEFVVELPLA